MRFIPRFSLRTIWIALTIFLIAFGVVVNYYQRYQTHEQIATKLQNVGYEVEETTSTFLGYPVSKTLTGLHCGGHHNVAEKLAALGELPRPLELLRLSYLNELRNQTELELLINTVERFPNLEELYLEDLIFTEAQFARLGGLTKLRVLSLDRCNVPPGGLALLARMPQLEKLLLHEAHFRPAELQALTLPNLRVLDLSETPIKELALTKAGWGRSPKLETLILGESNLDKVTCEAGALPNLRQLDLAYQDGTLIDWPTLPAAAPQLDSLAVHERQLSIESAAALRQLPRLRYMHFNTELTNRVALHLPSAAQIAAAEPAYPDTLRANPPKTSVPKIHEVALAVGRGALAFQLANDRPDLLFCGYYAQFHALIEPRSHTYGGPAWASANWRQSEDLLAAPPRLPFPMFSSEPLEAQPILPPPFPMSEPTLNSNPFDLPPLPPELQRTETPIPDLSPLFSNSPARPTNRVDPNKPIAPFTNPLGLPGNDSPVPTFAPPLREMEK